MKDNNDYQTFPPVCFQARSRFTVFKLLIPFIKGWRFKKKKKINIFKGFTEFGSGCSKCFFLFGMRKVDSKKTFHCIKNIVSHSQESRTLSLPLFFALIFIQLGCEVQGTVCCLEILPLVI